MTECPGKVWWTHTGEVMTGTNAGSPVLAPILMAEVNLFITSITCKSFRTKTQERVQQVNTSSIAIARLLHAAVCICTGNQTMAKYVLMVTHLVNNFCSVDESV